MDRKHTAFSIAIILLFLLALPIAQYADRSKDRNLPPTIVQPVSDIEFLWEIEDTRKESASPLVTYMENHGSSLGYDAKSNTFYCTLGLNTGEDWPDISLTAPNASGVSICLVDDYTYDWCNEAIEEGYSYELMAYTTTEYAYFSLVFTGLPIVSLHTQEEIGLEYVPSYTSISSSDYAPVESLSKVHYRGALSLNNDKKSYRIELHRINQKGRNKRNRQSLLGMPKDSDWLLIANPYDFSGLRNHLAWDMWSKWNENQPFFSPLQSRMVEVFVNDEYCGLYQMMQRIDTDQEILRMGGNLETDCAFRIIKPGNAKDRPFRDYKSTADIHLELRKPPQNLSENAAFEIVNPYIELADIKQGLLNDESFLHQFANHMDTEDVVSYYLFSQAIGLGVDNVYNNLYIWALNDGNRYRFSFAPWDMNQLYRPEEAAFEATPMAGTDSVCAELRIPVRLLNLDGLNSREILWSLWRDKRKTILSDDAVYQWLYDAEALVNRSGAYARNAQKWTGKAAKLNISELYAYAIQHLNLLDRYMRECWPYGEYTPDGKPTIDLY